MQNAIVTTCDANFLVGAQALLQSTAKYHPESRRYCFVPEVDLVVCSRSLSSWADVMPFPRLLRNVPARFMVNAARVFAATVPEEHVVYLDADILVCGRIDRLWDVEGRNVTAVADSSERVIDNLDSKNAPLYERHFPSVARSKGLNGGVWGLSTKFWADLPERFESVLKDVGLQYERIIDQPVLNALFQPNVIWLPFAYNAHCLFDNAVPRDVRVMHFTSVAKPWMDNFPKHEPAYWYWLKYGPQQVSGAKLFLCGLWVLLNSPKRLMGRQLRRLRG